MQNTVRTFPIWALATVSLVGAIGMLSGRATTAPEDVAAQAAAPAPVASPADAKATGAAAAVAAVAKPSVVPVALSRPQRPPAIRLDPDAVRPRLKYETVRFGGKRVKTLSEDSRILLTQAAAAKAGLHSVGLSFADVYGVIEAETSWIPRTGRGRNGVRSYGLAQFEPGTAKGLGLKNPNDPVAAVFAAAVNLRHGARWAARKIDHLDLPPGQHAAKLREGVSVYYNLSVKGRNKWNGVNTARLPVETRRHIRNVRAGAREALQLARQLGT